MIYFGIVAVDSIFHRILAAQDIDLLAICDRIIEPVDEVHLCSAVIEFIRVPRENVANAHDLRQIAFIDCIGPTHDHNLAAAFENGFLQELGQFIPFSCLVKDRRLS